MVFSNPSELEYYIKTMLRVSMDEVAIIVEETIRKYLYDNFYSYTPKVYDRTYEFFNSITRTRTVQNGNNYEVQVYFDTDKITPHYETKDDTYPKHVSINGDDVSEWIPILAEEAKIYPKKLGGEERGHFVEDSMNELQITKKHINALAKLLQAKGITVKI